MRWTFKIACQEILRAAEGAKLFKLKATERAIATGAMRK